MYAINTRVWVKSAKSVGYVIEAHYETTNGKRHAAYVIEFRDDQDGPYVGDFLTGSNDLRAADWCCDGCGRWLPNGSRAGEIRNPWDNVVEVAICFVCKVEAEKNAGVVVY